MVTIMFTVRKGQYGDVTYDWIDPLLLYISKQLQIVTSQPILLFVATLSVMSVKNA